MESMLAAWIVFLFASFPVSILALTYIQVRGATRHGWRGLRDRPFLETYWRELSPVEKGLLWPGLVTFGITLSALAVWKIATSVGQ